MKLKYIRCKHIICTLNDSGFVESMKHHTYKNRIGQEVPSISAAKRESRKLQESDGGLGRGSLKVVQSMKELEYVDQAAAA